MCPREAESTPTSLAGLGGAAGSSGSPSKVEFGAAGQWLILVQPFALLLKHIYISLPFYHYVILDNQLSKEG